MRTTRHGPLARRVATLTAALALAANGSAQTLQARLDTGGHILRRTSNGVSPLDVFGLVFPLATPQATLIANYLAAQQNPASIPQNPDLTALLAQYPTPVYPNPAIGTPDLSVLQLAEMQIARAAMSTRQLQELLANFWDEHFNTYYWKEAGFFEGKGETQEHARELAAFFEWEERDAFRTHCLGTFQDLLTASVESEAMLIYLDNVANTATLPNENYARELLELHTLGLDPVTGQNLHYNISDIQKVAQILAGWTVRKNLGTGQWGRVFDGTIHTSATHVLFGTAPQGIPITIPANTAMPEMEGYDLIGKLANHPHTADFICRKLIKLFVTDTEPATNDPLLQACTNAWGTQGGNIGAVVNTILTSTEFQSTPSHRWTMARSPLESLAHTIRTANGKFVAPNQVANARGLLEDYLDQALFRFPSPDGFPGESNEQVSTASYLGRVRFNQEIYSKIDLTTGLFYQNNTFYNPLDTLNLFGSFFGFTITDELAIADFYLLFMFQSEVSTLDTAFAQEFLISRDSQGNPVTQNLAALLASGTTADLQEYIDRISSYLAYLNSFAQAYQK